MARPRKPRQFDPFFHQALRYKFIAFADEHKPQSAALRHLGTEVWAGKMTVSDWALKLHQSGTLLEIWAQDSIDSWKRYDASPAAPTDAPKPWRTGRPIPPGCPPPRMESDRVEMVFPLPRASESASYSSSLSTETDIERIFSGSSPPTPIEAPDLADFTDNIQMAALYVLCGLNKQQVLDHFESIGKYYSAANIQAKLRGAMDLLELKRKPTGRPANT
jgi:hypothetical protein